MQEMKPQKAELLKKLEVGLILDEELKCLIRAQLERRVLWINSHNCEQRYAHLHNHVQSLRPTSVEMETNEVNPDAYDDVPIEFSKLIHGRAMKMSWCYFEAESTTLDDAEVAMLDLYCERAQIKDGDQVLDIGCGYGSLVIYIARKYPNCHVTGITDTTSQKEYIVEQCRNQNLNNVEVILADVTEYNMDKAFDRVMVIEVFEPLNEDDWIEEIIFPDMILTIPSADFLLYFQTDVSVVNHWVLNGKHVARSSEVWLKRLDANADTAKAVVEAFTGCEKEAMKWINYTRASFLHGIEQGGYNNGEEWLIVHILFKK
ncbi:hypothetical protein Sjap_010809 [Stephania japonica]|uniref:Uncharacterized protein n=1 Tax=Stephania japonica TaxID=461633 RepID=A0AAP0JCC2_9MAGN